MLLQREQTKERKLLLVMKLLDMLEQDYCDDYPGEKLVIEGGFEETMREKLMDLWK